MTIVWSHSSGEVIYFDLENMALNVFGESGCVLMIGLQKRNRHKSKFIIIIMNMKYSNNILLLCETVILESMDMMCNGKTTYYSTSVV